MGNTYKSSSKRSNDPRPPFPEPKQVQPDFGSNREQQSLLGNAKAPPSKGTLELVASNTSPYDRGVFEKRRAMLENLKPTRNPVKFGQNVLPFLRPDTAKRQEQPVAPQQVGPVAPQQVGPVAPQQVGPVANNEAVVPKPKDKGSKNKWSWLTDPFAKVGKAISGLFSGFSSKSESESEGGLANLLPVKKPRSNELKPDFPWEDFRVDKKLGTGGSSMPVYSMRYRPDLEKLGNLRVAGKFGPSVKPGKRGKNIADPLDEFRHEKEMMEKLPSSPNLLEYVGLTKRNDAPILLMEEAEKGDMAGAYKAMDQSDLSAEEKFEVVRYLTKGALTGIKDVHSADLVHGDIKDQNIFLDQDLVPKVGDFGTAQTTQKLAKEKKSPTTRVGTSEYMAPEVVTKGISKKSDIWSLGETVLQGMERMDSVDVARGRTKTEKEMNKELVRAKGLDPENPDEKPLMANDEWMRNLGTSSKMKDVQGFGDYTDFIGKSMTRLPEKRSDAEALLAHPFLQGVDATRAKGLLTRALEQMQARKAQSPKAKV